MVSAMLGVEVGSSVGFVLAWLSNGGNTRADQIADLLRNRVIEGRYPLGAELSASALAGELNTHPATVREGLRVLRREGLLIKSPRGVIVRSGARAVGVAACEFREALDGLAARLAAERAEGRVLSRLTSCVEELRRAIGSDDMHAAGWADTAFHLSILGASENQLLIGQAAIVASALRAIRSAYIASGDAIVYEHEKIVAAVGARDASGAEAAARVHARSDMSRILKGSAPVQDRDE
jgi:DNA-binding GntR family transcriptional regulator